MTDTGKEIEGVIVKPRKLVRDDRGWLMEVLRADDPDFRRFGQVYVTVARPGVVKAWHCHERQTDHLAVVAGVGRIALYDGRDGSPTAGNVVEVIAGEDNPVLVVVPPGVYHGFASANGEPVHVLNLPTELYDYDNPDELRRPYNDPGIPYDWGEADPASG
ncbi:MAG: dTDP-4-dehydrorhamnose 3,5-epimerase family protein [Candidatus Zixiibacteriota bacterium]|jgi:dTDP-4-dehydrorhamnose 3,5-epimerase